MHNIALIGKARAGKDTAALWLVRNRSYTRLAFADPLKALALKVDPIIAYGALKGEMYCLRLAELVTSIGWESAKDNYPEVRRVLQHMGQGQREIDEDYWLNLMRPKLNSAEAWNLPIVVTDVRYRNEAEMLRARGFKLVRLTRGVPDLGTASAHPSETELDDFPTDVTIVNGGGIDALHAMVAAQV